MAGAAFEVQLLMAMKGEDNNNNYVDHNERDNRVAIIMSRQTVVKKTGDRLLFEGNADVWSNGSCRERDRSSGKAVAFTRKAR